MRVENLASPGMYSNGFVLRREAAKAISAAEITARATPGGRTRAAAQLSVFFADCVTKLASIIDATLPTISARVATLATQVNITFSENMDQSVVPALAAFTSAGNTITAVAWTSATNLRLTGTGFAAGENLTYTQPAVNAIRDLAGNLAATSSANLT